MSNFGLFPVADIAKWPRGGHLAIVFGVKIIIYFWKFILELKEIASLYSFQYWLFPNSQ